MEAPDASFDACGRTDTSEASTTISSSCASANITGETSVWPRWFAKNVRQVWDRAGGRPCRYRERVRSEMAIPSFSNSPLDQHQRFPPPGPQPPQQQPKQTVSWAKAPLRTSEDAELVVQGKSLEQEVSTLRPGRSDRSTRRDDGSHRL